MLRTSPAKLVPLCVLLAVVACDSATTTEMFAPDDASHEIIDGRNSDSNVYLAPPIGQSYTPTLFDAYTPNRVELCTIAVPDTFAAGLTVEDYTAAHWNDLEGSDCLPDGADPWFAYYEDDSSTDGVTFIELKTDINGDPQQFQVNLKTVAGMANQAFRVKVLTLDLDLAAGQHWEEKARFGLALFENSSAINVPADWIGETANQNFPVKWVSEMEAGDNFLVEIDCTPHTVTGTTAAVDIQANTFQGCDTSSTTDSEFTLVLLQERVELAGGQSCIPVGWVQDGLCYRWQFYLYDPVTDTYSRYTEPLAQPMLVIYCIASPETDWAGLRTPFPYDSEVYPTENTSGAGIFTPDCDALTATQSGGVLGFLDAVRSSVGRLIGLDPEPLYAADRGFGELVGATSHFGRADAREIVKVSGDGQVGLVGAELGTPLVARAVTIPHHAEDAPEGIAGATVTFGVTAGGGTLRDGNGNTGDTLDVVTDGDGYATVWWVLGATPSPPDHTVDVFGDGFGFLDANNTFVATRTYTATAFDVVTDFLEPLDAKGIFSGGPHQQFAPEVLICAAPADGQPCSSPAAVYGIGDIKVTEDNGRKFFQVNWKPRDSGIAQGTFVVQVRLESGPVVGESVNILVDKGGKVELTEAGLQINPTTDLPIKFTLSEITL